MTRDTLNYATCDSCPNDETDDNDFRVTGKDMKIDENSITFDVACSCGVTGKIIIDSDGTRTRGGVSHIDGKWESIDE